MVEIRLFGGEGHGRTFAEKDAAWFGHRDPPHIAAIKRRMADPRAVVRLTEADIEHVRTTADPVAEARMIRWLTATGEFDTNDPCDEWPSP